MGSGEAGGVGQLAERLVRAYNDKDAAAFAGLFDEQAEFVNVMGMRSRGRAQIDEHHQQAFSTVLAGTTIAADGLDVACPAPGVEVGVLRWTRERHPDAPPVGAPAGEGVFTLVAADGAAGWRLTAASNVEVRQPPAPPAAAFRG